MAMCNNSMGFPFCYSLHNSEYLVHSLLRPPMTGLISEGQEYPRGASVNDKKFLRRFTAKFFISNGILYKRNHDSTLLRCGLPFV